MIYFTENIVEIGLRYLKSYYGNSKFKRVYASANWLTIVEGNDFTAIRR